MSVGGINLDKVAVLVDKLANDPERFIVSNYNFKNSNGLTAVFEIKKLASELYDFAKNPEIAKQQLGPVKPKQPDLSKLNEEEAMIEEQNYKDLIKLWEMEKKALSMQVPTEDMYAIERYVMPFDDTLAATPAVKSFRFKALTKNVPEEQGGFLGFGKKQQQQ